MAYPGAPRFAHTQGILAPYKAVLGANLLELWHASMGWATSSNELLSWTGQINGNIATPESTTTRPLYQPDGANFRGKNVVMFYKSPARYMRNATSGSSSPLLTGGATSDNPSLFVVGRLRDAALTDTSNLYRLFEFQGLQANGKINQVSVFFKFGTPSSDRGFMNNIYSETGAVNYFPTLDPFPMAATPTTPFVASTSNIPASGALNSGQAYSYLNSGLLRATSGGQQSQLGGVNWWGMGGTNPAYNGVVDLSIAVCGFVRQAMTAQQHTDLVALAKSEWGF